MGEHIGHLFAGHPLDPFHQVISLSQDLFNAVFDPVVNGLDQVAGPTGADVGDAWAVIHLGGHFVHQAFDGVIGRFGATGHHAGTFECALGAPRNAHPDEAETTAFQLLHSPFGVVIVGVATVNEEVALLKER